MLLTLFAMVAPVTTHAEKEPPTLLKVAFSQLPGITELTEDGSRKGIVSTILTKSPNIPGGNMNTLIPTANTLLMNF